MDTTTGTDSQRHHVMQLFGSSQEDDKAPPPLVPRRSRWRYPHFESFVDTIHAHVTRDRSSIDPGQNAKVYILEEGFLPEDRRWIDDVRVERMHAKSQVLYRPEIVNDLVQKIEDLLGQEYQQGLLVKGPQGIGKSHSLINLTRYLLASEKYWVTIIPNCDEWTDEIYFFRALLESVGVDPDLFGLDYDVQTDKYFKKLIDDIDTVLSQLGMKWIFIFDQVNRIFARPQFQTAKEVGLLPFPFYMMDHIMEPGRILSIISASANDDVSYRENHRHFEAFEHPIPLNRNEIKLLYPSDQVAKWDWEEVEYATGCVPMYLNRWAKHPHDYASTVCKEIIFSLGKFKGENADRRWKWSVESAIQCLLYRSSIDPPLYFDRKYLVVEEDKTTGQFNVVALFPLVEEAYCKFFWDQLSQHMDGNEATLWNLRKDAPQDMRGRLFEQLVIRRIVRSRLSTKDVQRLLKDANLAEEIDVTVKAAQEGHFSVIQVPNRTCYPQLLTGENQLTYFIPQVSHFPTTDLIIHVGKIVIVFQIHLSHDHQQEVLTSLQEKVAAAGWNQAQVQKIILVYLSPMNTTARRLENRLAPKATVADWYTTLFYSIRDLDTLRNLQWRG